MKVDIGFAARVEARENGCKCWWPEFTLTHEGRLFPITKRATLTERGCPVHDTGRPQGTETEG